MDLLKDEEVLGLKEDIISDLHAQKAAERLLAEAIFLLQCGQPLRDPLLSLLCDGLDHLLDSNPLLAFGHIHTPRTDQPGNARQESEAEWLELLGDVYRKAIQLGKADSKKDFEKSAFYASARERLPDADDAAVCKEAKRLRSGWKKRMETLPAEVREGIRATIECRGTPTR